MTAKDHRQSHRGVHVSEARVEGSDRRPFWRRRPESRLERIGQLPIFRHLSASSLRQLLPLVDDVRVAAGTVILSRGSQLRHLYLVAEGTAGTIGPTGELHLYGPGQTIGLDELFRTAFIPYTIVAVTDLQLLTMRRQQFAAASQTIPAFSYELLKARCALETPAPERGIEPSCPLRPAA